MVGLDRLVGARQQPGERAADRELRVAPVEAGVSHRMADRVRAEVEPGDALEPAEGVHPHADDRDVHAPSPRSGTGANAYVTTSVPSASRRNGTTTSCTGMPIRQSRGARPVSRVSTITSPGSST